MESDPSTRLTATAEYGMAFQDDMLMPYAVDSSRGLLPRQSADAAISNLMIKLKATTSLTPKLKLAAKFRHFSTDNQTPISLFQPVVNDTGPQQPVSGDQSVFNLPVQYSQNQGNLDLSFQLWDATILKTGFQVLHKDRDFRAIDESIENKFSLGISSNELNWMSVTASLSYARTDTDGYNFENVRALRNTPQFWEARQAPFGCTRRFQEEGHSRKQSTSIHVKFEFFPVENLTIGVSHNWIQQKFPEQFIGLQEVRPRAPR